MSTLTSQARTRFARTVETAGLRSRLALVPPRAARARRTPFVVLVLGVLAVGVVGLLMFNTHMQQGAFHATALQNQARALSGEEQSLQMQLEQLRDPQALASRARALGMVVPSQPAFVRLSDGRVLGDPTVTTPDDAMKVGSPPARRPALLNPKAKVVHVKATTAGTSTAASSTKADTSAHHGAASAKSVTSHGRKKGH